MSDRATEILHFRATAVQKAEILKRAKVEGKSLSAYLLGRALPQAQAEDPDPVLPKIPGAIPVDAGTKPGDLAPPPQTREQFIERRVRWLFGTGLTTRAAKARAAKEWDQRQGEAPDP